MLKNVNHDKKTGVKVPIVVLLFLSVFLYLYTTALEDNKISHLPKVKWNDEFGSISYHSKLMKQSDKKHQIKLTSKPNRFTSLPSKDSITTSVMGHSTTQSMNGSELMKAYKLLIKKEESFPILTLFTTWSDDAGKYLMHNLTSINWLSLRPHVIPVIFTNESGVANECTKLGWEVFPVRRVAGIGRVPVLKFMYLDVMTAFNSTFYAYANSDILFTSRLVETLFSIAQNIDLQKPALIVGQRTNVPNITKGEGSSWENIIRMAKVRGTLFEHGVDYFITQRTYPWSDIPELIIGQLRYDNWLVLNSRESKHQVIDITQTSVAVHQTTSVGNFESEGHKDSLYDHELLKNMNKSTRYIAGVIQCIEEKSVIDDKGFISIRSVKVGNSCQV